MTDNVVCGNQADFADTGVPIYNFDCQVHS